MAAEAEDAGEAGRPSEKKPRALLHKLVDGIAVFLLGVGAVIVGGAINAELHPIPDFKLDKDGRITAIAPAVASVDRAANGGAKQALYYAIDPPFVVNFEDGSAVRFLQITMEVMARDQKAIDSVQRNMPLIRNNLLLLMSNRDYQSLMSREGKENLRKEALAELRSVQRKQGGEDVEDLLFTSFVVQ